MCRPFPFVKKLFLLLIFTHRYYFIQVALNVLNKIVERTPAPLAIKANVIGDTALKLLTSAKHNFSVN